MVGPVVVPGIAYLGSGVYTSQAPSLPMSSQLEVFMRSRLFLMLVLCLGVAGGRAQTTFPGYFSTADLAPASPGAFRFGLYGFDNPAVLSMLHQPDATFSWVDRTADSPDLTRWGLFTAVPNLGFGMVRTGLGGASITDYRLALGFGDRTFAGGFSYGWSSGDRDLFHRSNVWTLGFLIRPERFVSLGLTGAVATADNSKEATVDLAVRPFGTELVTLFGDYALAKGISLRDGQWSAGAVAEVLPGIRVVGRYFDTHAFTVGLDLSLGNIGGGVRPTFDNDARHSFTTYTVRLGAYDRNIIRKLMAGSQYVKMDMNGEVVYRTYRWFDGRKTLASVLESIEAARTDETVGGIAINMSGMQAGRSMLWEIRRKLSEFRASGKKVVVFMDRADLDDYHFASVADRIVMDPLGQLVLHGYAMGRTFYRGTLEKLGIAYDEWRYFTYKSASEVFSRDSMSAPDREQRQKLVDDAYALAKQEICASGRMTPDGFERIVNTEVLLSPAEARAQGLVDSLGRWEDVDGVVRALEGASRPMTGQGQLEHFNLPHDNRWGEPPRIALIYALGACDMDEGIRARSLVKNVQAAVEDARVKAIVLRVDSPGGDAMASDYIAAALRKAKGKKPVIVSQGSVAASGGYWLSMYGDTIVANPGTITGSVGVIGGWFYNAGFKEKLGMSTDHVQAGSHADLGFGFALPFIGAGIPDRNLTPEEREKAGTWIKDLYAEFVGKVAEGRSMDRKTIDSIGQGRVWSGSDGVKNGLVDVLGGIDTALKIAREAAGIGAGEEVTVVEAPQLGLFDLGRLMPSPFGVNLSVEANPAVEQLLFRLRHNGEVMPIVPLDEMPAGGE
jgi:protease IV